MGEVGIIGLDLAKSLFQAHGAGSDGSVLFRRKLSRVQLLKFMAAQPPCVVGMEACEARITGAGRLVISATKCGGSHRKSKP